MKNLNKLKELLLKKIDLTRIMQDYNVDFVFNPERTNEVQFRCPFHGEDNKPSARLYRETQSAFCWVCRKRWDIISFVMEKENINFGGALRYLIKKYNIDISSIPDGPSVEPVKYNSVPVIKQIMSNVDMKINELKYKIPFEKYNILCAVYDNIAFKISKGINVMSSAEKLESKIYTIMESQK